MVREQIFYDIPQEWIENRNHKLCPVCAKTKNEFDKHMKIYCSVKCQQEFNSRIFVWGSFKDKFIDEHGRICNKCKITEREFNKQKEEKLVISQQEYIKIHREGIELLKVELINEIEKLNNLLFDEDKLMDSRVHLLYDYPSKLRDSESIYFEVDHIVAIKNGGKMWDKTNLQVLCGSCHKEKTKIDLKIDNKN